jgi:Pyoverdine/dityrosine biosynthesis protein
MSMFDGAAPQGVAEPIGPLARAGRGGWTRTISAGCAAHLATVSRWQRLAELVRDDPTLRLHCALRPPADLPTAVGDGDGPRPPHPRSPGRARTVGLTDLVVRGAEDRTLLERIIANQHEPSVEPLDYFVEYFVRPVVVVFRALLDRHGLALLDLNQRTVRFELTAGTRATGRIVLSDVDCLREAVDVDAIDIDRAARGLHEALCVLAAGFQQASFAGRQYRGRTVRAAVEAVLARELRFVGQETAELLHGDHPLDRHVHTVPDSQDKLLREVLRRVEERSAARRRDPSPRVPAVVIDLDLCGLVPKARTLHAARTLSRPRQGAPRGIPELAKPGSLRALPSYSKPAWDRFLELSGVAGRYPEVEWDDVHAEFCPAFYRPWERLRSDSLASGLVRFVRDVEDAGGEVVFNTGRRDRVREHTKAVLARGGLAHVRLLTLPDDRVRPIAELKVENLRRLGDLDVVAVFDDLTENRQSLSAAFPGAMVVAVEAPGFASDRAPGCPPPDGAPLVATFERLPRHDAESPAPVLSHTHSIAELQVGELTASLPARGHAVNLSVAQTLSIVDRLVADADAAAVRTAAAAPGHLREALAGVTDPIERTVLLLHHVFMRKQFHRGSRGTYPPEMAARDLTPFLRRGAPIQVVLPGFPVKQSQSGLKASGVLPDLAELGVLVRLRELQQTVKCLYEPGLRITVLTDGHHFRPRPTMIVESYLRKLNQYLCLVGGQDFLEFTDIDEVARGRVGPSLDSQRVVLIDYYENVFRKAFEELDITADPMATLGTVARLDPMRTWNGTGPGGLAFRDMFRSILHSVSIEPPAGKDRMAWSKAVYTDLYQLADPTTPADVVDARRQVLRTAWQDTIRYLSAVRADRELGYDHLFQHRVRLTVSMPSTGRVGFAALGGSALLPWHGTAAVDEKGTLSTDFALWLYDQGFVPVYSPMLGYRQPWLMAPVTSTTVVDTARGAQLDPGLLEGIHLRRK